MDTEIKAIIFDLGNVLIGFDHRIAVNRILKYTAKNADEIYALFFDSEFTREFEKGKISQREFFKKVKLMLELEITENEFLPIWNEIFFPNPGIEEFIISLAPRLKLLLLSNINKLHCDYIRANFSGLIALFDEFIPSFTTGFIKPQREIYEMAVRLSGESSRNIVYIDDRRDLVEAAQGYGIKSIRFQNVQQLKQEFQNLRIPFRDKISV